MSDIRSQNQPPQEPYGPTADLGPAALHDRLQVGIVGCGIMGRGIAQIAALAGSRVLLVDGRDGAAAAAHAALEGTFTSLSAKGKLPSGAGDAALARLQVCQTLSELASCDLVIEAIVESLDAKKILFAQLEDIVGESAILATNTSSLSVTSIGAGLRQPARVAGFHFFNPVPLMKIVEVIGGLLTDAAVLQRLLDLGRAWGHSAVLAKDTPGFIVNHAGRGLGTEGMRLLNEGVTSIANLDRILRDCAGFKLGPCELMDLTGLDVSHPVMESIYHQYFEEPRFRPQGLTRQMLAAGLLGKKVGRGFYQYDADGKKRLPPQTVPVSAAPQRVWLSRAQPALAERILSAGFAFEADAKPSAGALCIVTPLGDDCTACVLQEGLDPRRTVAIDALFDQPQHHVLMTNPATVPEFLARACGLFGGAGAHLSVVRDSAGLVAQRVVAHIINIACEMAQQSVALPLDIDRAVQLGLGYPHGPLAWGDLLGPATVLALLENLHRLTGDPRYRPSPWLQRRARLRLSLLHQEAAAP